MYIPFIIVELLLIVASFTRIIAWMYSVKEKWKQSGALTLFIVPGTMQTTYITLSHLSFITPLRGSYDYLY